MKTASKIVVAVALFLIAFQAGRIVENRERMLDYREWTDRLIRENDERWGEWELVLQDAVDHRSEGGTLK